MERVLVFNINNQRYAFHLSIIERVIRVVEVIPLPKAPDIVSGIINMQGQIIPVLDLRKLFYLPGREIDMNDQMIIAHTSNRMVAILADSVTGVVECREQDIIPSEEIFTGIEYLKGAAKLKDGIIYIYDINKFLSLNEKEIKEHSPEVCSTVSEGSYLNPKGVSKDD